VDAGAALVPDAPPAGGVAVDELLAGAEVLLAPSEPDDAAVVVLALEAGSLELEPPHAVARTARTEITAKRFITSSSTTTETFDQGIHTSPTAGTFPRADRGADGGSQGQPVVALTPRKDDAHFEHRNMVGGSKPKARPPK
jgi:hypothetical protein